MYKIIKRTDQKITQWNKIKYMSPHLTSKAMDLKAEKYCSLICYERKILFIR
jgi:hypothetical protein